MKPSIWIFIILIATFLYKSFPYNIFSNNSPVRKQNSLFMSTLFEKRNLESYNGKKFVVVTGGVISGIGKGITASSIGLIFKMMWLHPSALKIDPYLNIDAGTMSPAEHGEVFVLDDGAETDLDLGNYERFLDVSLTKESSLTTGKVYESVISRERKGAYLGKTVQIIPHVTDEIISRILSVSKIPVESDLEPDVVVIELGGTIGDIESMPFVEAIRQLQLLVGPECFCLVHVSMVPSVGDPPEQKSKPTQHSVKELRALGLSPDLIVCRSNQPLNSASKQKISLFCNLRPDQVLSAHDVSDINEVPLLLVQQGLHEYLRAKLQISTPIHESNQLVFSDTNCNYLKSLSHISASLLSPSFVTSWVANLSLKNEYPEVKIAIVGKYHSQGDAYLSVTSALRHSCKATEQALKVIVIDSISLELDTKASNVELYNTAWQTLRECDGVLVPGGFGNRGVEGKIATAQFCREMNIPFLGICLGMQIAVIEAVRNLLNRNIANSEEFSETLDEMDKAVVFMPEGSRDKLGGTMRLGARKSVLTIGSLAQKLYSGANEVWERHRHRYEVNPKLVNALENVGMRFSGRDDSGERMEILEIENHPFFIASQFHPEFKSRPNRPAPLFLGFLAAIKKRREQIVP